MYMMMMMSKCGPAIVKVTILKLAKETTKNQHKRNKIKNHPQNLGTYKAKSGTLRQPCRKKAHAMSFEFET